SLGESSFDDWESVVSQVRDETMPPADEAQPTADERKRLIEWYQSILRETEPHPGFHRPRRLSAHEYRNTLHSVFGFPLEVAVIEAEQTDAETSLVMKLLPTDPPGPSGFKNDTSANPLTRVVWEQYSYLIDNALDRLFGDRRDALRAIIGPVGTELTPQQARTVIVTFAERVFRRRVSDADLAEALDAIASADPDNRESTVRAELKTMLLSPRFLYRGLMMETQSSESRFPRVDDFELAQRLSYFLWADMPDQELLRLASESRLSEESVLRAQVKRMLASPKSRSLAEHLCLEWFSLDEIDHVSNNPPVRDALKSQPLDFLHDLFTQDRLLTELIVSERTFINPHTAKFYPGDRSQMTGYKRSKGIEIERVANQSITLEKTKDHRGGLLTMPGVLAMNRGPILRGTWMLERILGERLPEPPANVGSIPPRAPGEDRSFRERFEIHRANRACAVCHDKLDPLGFALQHYGNEGSYLPLGRVGKKRKNEKTADPDPATLDASGALPSGERFADFSELRQILVTSRREQVVRNIVERTLAYALCRKLTLQDRATIDNMVLRLNRPDATYGDLIHLITECLPFRHTAFRETTP
ncbi:MAG: DUF1592 domain-containing protein, partial [Planctomycetota bacterium]